MANEFVARKGLISSGSVVVSGSVTASYFKGDGSQLTNIGIATNIDTYTFSGDGTTTAYILSQSYNPISLFISVGGLSLINVADYNISASTVTFVTPPPSQSNVLIRAFVNATSGATGSFTGILFGTSSIANNVEYANVLNKPTLFSSSAQLPSGIPSNSAQIKDYLPPDTVSSSAQIQLQNISGTTFNNTDYTFPTSVTASNVLITNIATVRQLNTLSVTSSTIYESGSTKFGDDLTDTHQFTGSIQLQGTFYQNGIQVTLTSQDYGLITGIVDNFADYGSIV